MAANNVVEAMFDPETVEITRANIVKFGADFVEKDYIENQKLHPSFAKALIKKAIKKFAGQGT